MTTFQEQLIVKRYIVNVSNKIGLILFADDTNVFYTDNDPIFLANVLKI